MSSKLPDEKNMFSSLAGEERSSFHFRKHFSKRLCSTRVTAPFRSSVKYVIRYKMEGFVKNSSNDRAKRNASSKPKKCIRNAYVSKRCLVTFSLLGFATGNCKKCSVIWNQLYLSIHVSIFIIGMSVNYELWNSILQEIHSPYS